jgi:competence/damage-inducible protein CinA-like protein
LNAEIIAIGTELLLGEISDTNSARIARALRDIGLDLWWISAVGDNEARIAALVDQARRRSAVVITTGGLGPTVDDPTRAAVARAFGVPLEYRPALWAQIEARFQRYGRTPTENNRKQAYVPAGAVALENPVGTAPCFALPHEGGVVISLPGVPRELDYMLEHAVVPYLQAQFELAAVIRSRTLRTVGIGESLIDARIGELEALSNPTVGLAAHPGQTDIRITAKAATVEAAEALIAPIAEDIRRRLGDFIYAEGQVTVEAAVGQMLAARGEWVAVGEAGTRGDLAQRLAAIPDAPQVYQGGQLAAPSAAGKLSAAELAEAARANSAQGPTWGLGAVVALPPEEVRLEVALAGPSRTETQHLGFGGHPELAVRWAGTAALNMLRLALLKLNRAAEKAA